MARSLHLDSLALGRFEDRYTYSAIKVGSKTGETLLAQDALTDRPVVIKRPSPLQPNPDLRQASIADLAREERALRLPAIGQHPVACHLLEAGWDRAANPPYRYLVLERATGTPLPDLIQAFAAQGQSLPLENTVAILRQLLNLLAAAHQAGVVYNDVKPEHLFWDEQTDKLQVIDWGNAQFMTDAGSLTPAADVYQCGELLYELVTGLPYTRTSPPAPVDRDLGRILEDALQPDPGQRYADGHVMAAELEVYWLEHETATPTAEPPTHRPLTLSAFEADWNQALKSLTDETVEAETLLRWVETIRTGAQSQHQLERAKYLAGLADAYRALLTGALPEAVAALMCIEESPVLDLHWPALYRIYQLTQALISGDGRLARQACEPSGEEHLFGRLLAKQCALYASLVTGLQSFRDCPAEASLNPETWPGWLRSETVQQVLACSRDLGAARDYWRLGLFEDAIALYERSLAVIIRLPNYLEVELAQAATPVQTELDRVRSARQAMQQLLAKVAEGQTSDDTLRIQSVRPILKRMVDALPPRSGEGPDVGSGPQVWMRWLDDLVALGQQPQRGKRAQQFLSTIPLEAPIYPVFVYLNEGLIRPLPRVERRSKHWGWPRIRVRQQPGWLALGAVLLTATVGLLLTWALGGSARPTISKPTGLAILPTQLPSTPTQVVATLDVTRAACDKIAAAERTRNWQIVIDQVGWLVTQPGLPNSACGPASLSELAAEAHWRLGETAYQVGDFATAATHWTTAQELAPDTQPGLGLVLRCAQARAAATPELFLRLASDYNAADIQAACGFQIAAYIPPTPVTLTNFDLLADLAKRHRQISAPCAEAPCPTLYQDDQGAWHIGTFFEESAGILALDVGPGGDRFRNLNLAFNVASAQPYSFPYRAQFGLLLTIPDHPSIRIVFVSEAPFSARALVMDSESEQLLCPLTTSQPYLMKATDRTFIAHTLSVGWDPDGTLTVKADGQSLCAAAIPLTTPPELSIYYASAGLNLAVSQLTVSWAGP